MKSYVITTTTPWTEPPRFRKQIALGLAKFAKVYYVQLCAETCADDFLRKKVIESSSKISVINVEKNIVVIQVKSLSRKFPRIHQNIPPIHSLVDKLDVRKIEVALTNLGVVHPVLINFKYDFYEIFSSHYFRDSIYLCNDEFYLHYSGLKRAVMKRYEHRTVSGADFVVTHSEVLREKFKKMSVNKRVEVLYPGHLFDIELTKLNSVPDRRGKLGKDEKDILEVCYMGFIDDRLDYKWIGRLASLEGVSLTFIGPVKTEKFNDLKEAFSNIRHVGTLEGKELQIEMLKTDCFVIPFDGESKVVQACSPNKIIPYIACGRPVITTGVVLPDIISNKLYLDVNVDELDLKRLRSFVSGFGERESSEALSLANEYSWENVSKKLSGWL